MAKTALIVDDSRTIRDMVSLTLKEMGFDVETADDGAVAVDLVEGKKFSIVITDINMPNMDGIELIRYLRENNDYQYTPILVLTTERGDNAKLAGKEAGASGWMTKPFNPEAMRHAINKLCTD